MNKTGLIFFPAFDWAITPNHPEREERLLYTRDQLEEEGIFDLDEIKEFKAEMAEKRDILRVHFCIPEYEKIISNPHLISAGSSIKIGRKVINKEIENGFSLVRPPGHHAMRVSYGNRGFCNINNEAIMVEYLRKNYGYRKIVIVDTDVHHGDGTQDVFYNDPDVLYISFHQDGRTLYPGTGFIDEAGGPNAYGRNINIPLPPQTGDKGILMVMDDLVTPIIKDFEPELIINSAGQDNHFTDPLANMKFTAKGYAKLTDKLKPDIVVLEGGYAVESALPYVNMGIILSLAGLDYSNIVEPELENYNVNEDESSISYIRQVISEVSALWENQKSVDKDKMFGKKDFFYRNKHVFYDTDYLSENQVEKLRNCSECGGWFSIETHLDSRPDELNYCVSIPLYSCRGCVEEGKEDYERALRNPKYKNVFLQNISDDVYLKNGKDLLDE